MTLKFGWKAPLLAVASAACLIMSGCQGDGTTTTAPTRSEAWRFLTQSTFGPDEQSLQDVANKGYSNWIDEQFAQAPSISYTEFMNRRAAELQADQPGVSGVTATAAQMLEAFYTRALTDQSQLRARLVFALSEIFVTSMVNELLGGKGVMMMANYMDMLDSSLDGNFRELLENVTLSPAMGEYLTYRGNYKEDPAVGRQPDENYAREIMQLFSIGLYQLNPDGTQKLDANGQPIPTYTSADVKGLAKVFTGWGMHRTGSYTTLWLDACFQWWQACRDPAGLVHPMVSYPPFHSTSAKSFLGVTIPPQDTPSPEASLKVALDTLANHPNAAPFFSRQLIQRLVSSNPSPAYVGRVSARFTATGGNIKEVVKAILLDDEARSSLIQLSNTSGKLREPVLRVTALLRAFKFTSPTLNRASGPNDAPGTTRVPYLTLGPTGDPTTGLAQTPLYSPSVFNFFRPGYTPPNPGGGAVAHVAPEMQITSEASIGGYANFVMDILPNGLGPAVQTASGVQRDILFDLAEQQAVAYDVPNLIQHIADRLLGGTVSDNLKALMTTALQSISVPALDDTGSNGQAINDALNKRVQTAILLVSVSPEFILSK